MSTPDTQTSSTLFVRLWKKFRKWHLYPYIAYEAVAFVGRNKSDWRFMNYGFEPLDGVRPELGPEYQTERCSVQMYHFVASGGDLRDKDVLEIGSGRGGGTDFMHRHFKARSTTGLDLAPTAIAFSRKTFQAPGLSYQTGDACNLPFSESSFDVVVNVESSHLYPDPDRFVAEVYRVLRTGGVFLYADVLPEHLYVSVRARLESTGFTVQEERNISPEVLNSLETDGGRRRDLVLKWAPWPLKSFALMFAGVPGSYSHECIRSGKSRFFRFIAKK
jgi:SAM-dependent methyltransferase